MNIYIKTTKQINDDSVAGKRAVEYGTELNPMCWNCLTYCRGCADMTYTGCACKVSVPHLKALLKSHGELEEQLDKVEKVWSLDPCNEELEKKWDELYREELTCYGLILDGLQDALHVDKRTARIMFDSYRNRIEDLLSRLEP